MAQPDLATLFKFFDKSNGVLSFVSVDPVKVYYEKLLDKARNIDVEIQTWVTHRAFGVNQWIQDLHFHQQESNKPLIVGVHICWVGGPHHPKMAILALCHEVKHNFFKCLFFQIQHTPDEIPQSLKRVLENDDFVFVREGYKHVSGGFDGFLNQYGLPRVKNVVDLNDVVADHYNNADLRDATLQELASTVLGLEYEAHNDSIHGRADEYNIHYSHIKAAFFFSFAALQIGKKFGNALLNSLPRARL